MPKRKAPARSAYLNGDDAEDATQLVPQPEAEPPTKRGRGRPKAASSNPTAKPDTRAKPSEQPAPAEPDEPAPKKTGRRGRPKGSRTSQDKAAERKEETKKEEVSTVTSNDELDAARDVSKSKSKPAKSARGRKAAEDQDQADDEFQYTPASARRFKSPEKPRHQTGSPSKNQRAEHDFVPETQNPAHEAVDESILPDDPVHRSVSASPAKTGYNRLAAQRMLQSSPSKRSLGEPGESTGDPELRRRLGDLTKKYDTLESRFNRLREIGVVQANANMDKLRNHCETITDDSNKLVASLREELETQRALGKQSRSFHKQLQDRDAEVAQFKAQAEESATQLSSAQSEVKALQTKLAAARNTASTVENAAKGPGSAARNAPANRAQSAEAAQAAQLAQLKEDLYSDLTGLIIRDVKKRETDHLYDCIQTGTNGTLHFKLAVPNVSAANFESAEFQYIPLLDESRDRDLVELLPDYLTVDITFSRQQASKFYTRVIDALMKRRASQGD
ncbi:chromosome segregation protein pcs1 [Aspergillus sp. HF37]|nr:chromosome segregation protein pcs1 [Aspergillus sp. HF37]